MSIVGVGTDLVEVARFRTAMQRTASLADRLFSPDEREYASEQNDPVKSLAARFAAKEAVMKALGVGLGDFEFHDVEVVRARAANPCSRCTAGRRTLPPPVASRPGWCPSPTRTPPRSRSSSRSRPALWPNTGLMERIVTPEEMARADRRTIEAGTPARC